MKLPKYVMSQAFDTYMKVKNVAWSPKFLEIDYVFETICEIKIGE